MIKFELPEIEVVNFEVADVITTSAPDVGVATSMCLPDL